MENNRTIKENLQKEFLQKKFFYQIKDRLKNAFRISCIIIILIAAVLAGQKSIKYIKNMNLFNLNQVGISGNKYLSFNDIMEILEIKNYKNIFQVNLNQMKNKVELHPRIKSVSIRKILPNRLIIDVVERKAVALINIRKNFGYCLYEIDEDGMLIGEDPHLYEYDLPIITDAELENGVLGVRIKDKEVLSLLHILKKINDEIYDFDRIVAEINIMKDTELEYFITMYLNIYNIKVIFGKELNADKLYKLNSLLLVLNDDLKNVEYIDFQYNEAVSKFKI